MREVCHSLLIGTALLTYIFFMSMNKSEKSVNLKNFADQKRSIIFSNGNLTFEHSTYLYEYQQCNDNFS